MAGATVVATIVAASLAFAVPGSPPEVIDVLEPDPIVVAEGNGWGPDPSQTDGGDARLVEGPATPPLGRGSVELTVADVPDRAIVSAVPNGQPAPTPPTPSPWTDLSGSYSTFTFATENVRANLPTLRFAGFQTLVPVPTNFTTLSFVPPAPEVLSGVWQTWELGPGSIVFQSNATDGFCIQSAPCTLAAFAAAYPLGAWAQVQLGIGSGAPAGAMGYADAVIVRDGPDSEFSYDFEIPAGLNSIATVAPGAATDTGGTASVTLTASTLAASEVVFVVTTGNGTEPLVVPVAPGTTTTVDIPVGFGTTTVEVTAQDTVIASGTVTFDAAPPPAPPAQPAPAGSGAALPPTGPDATWPAIAAMLLAAAGIGTVAFARRRTVLARAPRR